MSDDCASCQHPTHNGFCRHPLTETIRDDVGIFAKPTGIRRTIMVGVCKCGHPPPSKDHGLDVVYHLPSSGYYSRCICGWRSENQMHFYTAERALVAHVIKGESA